MSRATPHMRKFAQRLIQYEADGKVSSGPKTTAGFDVCEKLRPALATLVGEGGYRALLGRALAMGAEEVPWLRELRIQADGSLAGWDELRGQIDPRQFTES